jgi:hypothetical protein
VVADSSSRGSEDDGSISPGTASIEVVSEFAKVRISRDYGSNGDRVAIEDVRGGRTAYLDPLELEALAWSSHADLSDLLDPGRHRWK